MDQMNELCKNCGHSFKLHQMATFGIWYCDFEDQCPCNNFEQQNKPDSDEYALEMPFDDTDTTYRWN